jgi:hypothetical protein
MRGYFDGSIHESGFASELASAMQLGGERSDDGSSADWEPVLTAIRALEKNAGSLTPAKFTDTVRRLQEDVRRQFRQNTDAPLLNFADDLVLFAARPNVTPAARAKYVQLRTDALRQGAIHASWSLSTATAGEEEGIDKDDVLREKIAAALKDPAMRPIADFLQFLDAAVVANDLVPIPIEGLDKDGEPYTYSSRDYKLLEDLTARFSRRIRRARSMKPRRCCMRGRCSFCRAPSSTRTGLIGPRLTAGRGDFLPSIINASRSSRSAYWLR